MSANTPSAGAVGKLPMEVLAEILHCAITSPANLQFRLVCSSFQDTADKFYLAFLRNAVFNLRSPDSIKALHGIGTHAEFAAAFTTLQFTCCYERYHDTETAYFCHRGVLKERGHPAIMSDAGWQKWLCLHQKNQACFGAAYDAVRQHVSDKEALTDYLVCALSRLKHVVNVYVLEDHLRTSKRYKFVYEDALEWGRATIMEGSNRNEWDRLLAKDEQKLKLILKSKAEGNTASCKVSLIAFDIFMRALARADLSPQQLAFSCPKLSFSVLGVLTPPAVLRQVVQKTERLTLRAMYPDWSGYSLGRTPRGCEIPEVSYTHDDFPTLKHLHLDCNDAMALTSTRVAAHKAVRLNSFTLRCIPDFSDPENLIQTQPGDFLNHFRFHLKHLVIVNSCYGRWNDFLRHLRNRFFLDKLEVVVEPAVWDAGTGEVLTCARDSFEGLRKRLSLSRLRLGAVSKRNGGRSRIRLMICGMRMRLRKSMIFGSAMTRWRTKVLV
ncbi:hypothetical protein K458DRAFT_488980 [Lentithecium fluviatile CBS 122367]|uniref:F-box domain-containing protein n=1 Tax=Lentithecium fluviatile CBS 122367 TaxID=1168545 RepID=A0A6G1IUM6_9PLEO|nr:hypothetical protein K458DRAFT_488980 [Lentithecium fluviatile CBS 122367]